MHDVCSNHENIYRYRYIVTRGCKGLFGFDIFMDLGIFKGSNLLVNRFGLKQKYDLKNLLLLRNNT